MNQKETWRESLGSSPFIKPRFTEQLKQDILDKTKRRLARGARSTFMIPVIAIILLCGAALSFTVIPKYVTEYTQSQSSESIARDSWKVRSEYLQDGKILLQAFPEPNLTAGKSQGYMIHFTAPFDTFYGKQVSIDAYHQNTGTRVVAVPPYIVTAPNPGYQGLDRFTATFALPLGGVWRYEVKLNGHFYGDFVLNVAEPVSWTVSPTFDLPYTANDGKQHKYVLAGEKGRAGFIVGPYADEKGQIFDQKPIVAKQMNKYMWFFWGSEEELTGSFNVSAVKEGSHREIGIYSAGLLGGPYLGANAQIPSSMELPEKGIWRLHAYINDKLFGTVYVEVE